MSSLFVFVGLDYHTESIRVCIQDPQGNTRCNRSVVNDPEVVYELIVEHGVPEGIAIEACCGAADFAERLSQLSGWTVKLAHPGYTHRFRCSPDKSDHDDAALLAGLVRSNYLPEVWLADHVTRQLRRMVVYRRQVQRSLKDLKLRIRSLLREERVDISAGRPWTKAWLEGLKSARLSTASRWIVDRKLTQLASLREQLHQVEKQLESMTAEDPLTQQLQQHDGIGLVAAVTLRAEIGTLRRFQTGKQLARFCGVTPCNASSGKRQADAGLVKAGSTALRAVLLQVAHVICRHVPKWKALKAQLRQRKPANVATAAVANRWIRWLFHQLRIKPLLSAAV
jgi:transposase